MTNPNDPVFSASTQESPMGGIGLTKRELFSAMALCVVNWHASLHDSKVTLQIIAGESVALADALIAELNKKSDSRITE